MSYKEACLRWFWRETERNSRKGEDRDFRLFLFSHTREGRAGERGCSTLLNARGDERIRRCENKKRKIHSVHFLSCSPTGSRLKISQTLPLSLWPSLVTQTYVKTPPTEAYQCLHTMRTCVRYFLSRHFHLQFAL